MFRRNKKAKKSTQEKLAIVKNDKNRLAQEEYDTLPDNAKELYGSICALELIISLLGRGLFPGGEAPSVSRAIAYAGALRDHTVQEFEDARLEGPQTPPASQGDAA